MIPACMIVLFADVRQDDCETHGIETTVSYFGLGF